MQNKNGNSTVKNNFLTVLLLCDKRCNSHSPLHRRQQTYAHTGRSKLDAQLAPLSGTSPSLFLSALLSTGHRGHCLFIDKRQCTTAQALQLLWSVEVRTLARIRHILVESSGRSKRKLRFFPGVPERGFKCDFTEYSENKIICRIFPRIWNMSNTAIF